MHRAEEAGGGRPRILTALDGVRRIALLDYGPYDAEPVLIFHGTAAGRRLPDRFRDGLIAAGFRPLVLQRPGFGLTDPATGDYSATGAADMAATSIRNTVMSVGHASPSAQRANGMA